LLSKLRDHARAWQVKYHKVAGRSSDGHVKEMPDPFVERSATTRCDEEVHRQRTRNADEAVFPPTVKLAAVVA